MTKEKSGMIGVFEIEVRNIKTGESKFFDVRNRVMDTFLEQLIDTLVGTTPDLEYKYMAIGTSNTPVTDTQTQLGAEAFRTGPSSASTKPSVGRREMEFTFLKADFVGTIEEVGVFAGAAASVTPNSGTMVSRILWNYDKSADEEIIIRRIDILGRG